jgi:tetratricopeptide (TPR) repeat protein
MPHIDLQFIALAVSVAIALGLLFVWNKSGSASSQGVSDLIAKAIRMKEQQQFVEAQLAFERALKELSAQKRPDVNSTVTCLTNLAQIYEREGKAQEARQVFQQVLRNWEVYIQQKGASLMDIDYALTNNDFGRGTQDIAQFYVSKVLPMRQQTLPAGHPEIAASRTIAARLLRRVGRTKEAEALEAANARG